MTFGQTKHLTMPDAAPVHVLALEDGEVIVDPTEPLETLCQRDGCVLWIDVPHPTVENLGRLAEVFHLHPLAVEDALKRQQRPKVEEYHDFLFITIHAARLVTAEGHDVALDEIDVFAGPRYLITSHDGTPHVIEEARRRVLQAPATLRAAGGYLLYVVLDTVVDSYFPVLDALDDYIEELEDSLFREPTPRALDRLFAARRALLLLRRVAAPQRDMVNLLMRHDSRVVTDPLRLYFRDIFDHLLRTTEQIDTHRDLLAGALDIYLSLVSNRLNEVMKVLTVVTAVFASLAVISGIYGMNFERSWPPFEWRHGFPATIAFMAAVVTTMLLIFRRKGWL